MLLLRIWQWSMTLPWWSAVCGVGRGCRNYQVIDAEEGTLENVVDLGVSQV